MKEKWQLVWSDKYVSGNEEIDKYHKFIINSVSELYDMLDNTREFRDKIPKMTLQIEEAMYNHMNIEIENLKQLDIEGWDEHEASHNSYKQRLSVYRSFSMPPAVHGILVAEVAREYMSEHFSKFDLQSISKIREKMKELK